jgi:hypothetical protein
LGITQHQTGVPGYGLAVFLMGNGHPTGLFNVITAKTLLLQEAGRQSCTS